MKIFMKEVQDNRREGATKLVASPLKKGIAVVSSLIGLITLWGSWYTVAEGHVGIVKRFSKAVSQQSPGFHFKLPLFDSVTEIEIRERKSVEELASATQNQLPVTAAVSINWSVNKDAAFDLYVKYGGLDQFENRVLDPRLRNAAKAAIAHFPADQLIRDRNAAVSEIMKLMISSTEGLPITVTSPQIENLVLPQRYLEAVMSKEAAREGAEKEKHALEKQRLTALQEVNTAEANKQAQILQAQGEAEARLLKATAEAKSIKLVNEQLSKSPLYIELVKAKSWNGVLPTHVLGKQGLLLNLSK